MPKIDKYWFEDGLINRIPDEEMKAMILEQAARKAKPIKIVRNQLDVRKVLPKKRRMVKPLVGVGKPANVFGVADPMGRRAEISGWGLFKDFVRGNDDGFEIYIAGEGHHWTDGHSLITHDGIWKHIDDVMEEFDDVEDFIEYVDKGIEGLLNRKPKKKKKKKKKANVTPKPRKKDLMLNMLSETERILKEQEKVERNEA